MAITSPAWLWLLVLPVLLLVIHMLGRNGRSLVVSSEMLWRELSRTPPRQRRLGRRPISLSLLAAVLILTALALAAAAPWRVRRKPPPALALILDRSWSMAAEMRPYGPRRIDVARDAARALLREESSAPFRLLILAGRETSAVSAASGEDEILEKALAAGEPAPGEGDLADVIAAAAAVVRSRGGGRVVVVSDFAGPRSSLPEVRDARVAVEAVSVGEPAPNVAVTSLVASAPSGPEGTIDVAATVRNGGPSSVRPTLDASLEGAGPRETLDLGPGTEATWSFPVRAPKGGLLQVRALPGGALSADDARQLRLAEPLTLRVESERSLPPAVAAAIEAFEDLATPRRGGGPVTLFLERLPDRLPSRWIFLASHWGSTRERTEPAVALDLLDWDSELRDLADLVLVDPAALPPLPVPAGAMPLALAGGRPVVAVVDAPGSRGVWWGVPIEATNLSEGGVLPLVLSRMLRWLGTPRDRLVPEAALSGADLTPRPPVGARDAAAIREGGFRSWPLRTSLLWIALVVAVTEGVRRGLEWTRWRSSTAGAVVGEVRLPFGAAAGRARR